VDVAAAAAALEGGGVAVGLAVAFDGYVAARYIAPYVLAGLANVVVLYGGDVAEGVGLANAVAEGSGLANAVELYGGDVAEVDGAD
ncbi:hypothetical protein A2U01_0085038, partial [Trifolium medium]|nr:hypothetical protein [Trifolium medium]